MLTSEIATIIRCVLFAADPISAADIDMRTGYGRNNIDDVLMSLQAAGDVELAECSERVARWRVTERWADAVPWRGTSRACTLREFVGDASSQGRVSPVTGDWTSSVSDDELRAHRQGGNTCAR